MYAIHFLYLFYSATNQSPRDSFVEALHAGTLANLLSLMIVRQSPN